MKGFIKYFIFFSIMPVFGYGQVYLSGLSSNTVIVNYLKNTYHEPQTKSSNSIVEALRLPFMDDFSNDGPYPDASRWLDSAVYINAHYPMFPVNYGAATFDVLDATGNIYSEANVFPLKADYLTSYPIRLDSIFDDIQDTSWITKPADSIYFSFYYQPQGRGDAPLGYDSLSLEFGTTDSVFSEIEKIWLQIAEATHSNGNPFADGDTIKPNDTVFYSGCQNSNFIISTDTLFYSDSIYVDCDSLFVPQTTWKIVWNAEGEELDSFLIRNNVFFKMVMIPITDSIWFRENFQFRFYNYGSLSSINSWKSNTDHWSIDKVYLNAGRSYNDIFTREIKFVQQAPSIIKTFSSMPRYHFSPDMLKESIIAYAHNNDSIPHDVTYSFSVQDEQGNYVPGLIGGFSGPMEPYYLQEVDSYQPFADAPVENELNPQQGPEEVYFTVNHFVNDNADPTIGDTIYHKQVFSNYFAYDDGTAERSYGASADNVKMAVQYRSFEADTLRGLQIYFNQVQDNYNHKYFHIGVWNDNNGKPGTMIFEKENQKPDLDHLNEFYTYVFGDTILRLGVNIYYVGVVQTTFDNLNIGFDRNNNSRSKTFYNTSATWVESPFDGSLMIRPIVGRALVESEPVQKSDPDNLEIYPNPPLSASQINFILPSGASSPDYKKYLTTRIYDLSGRLLFSAPFENQLNVSGLEMGFYIVDILDEAFTKHYTAKLLITK